MIIIKKEVINKMLNKREKERARLHSKAKKMPGFSEEQFKEMIEMI